MIKNKKYLLIAITLLLSLIVAGCSSPEEKRDSFMKNGRDLQKAGDLVKARLEYKNAIQVDPKCVECLVELGNVELALRNLRGAYAAYVKASEIAPERQKIQIALGKILLMGRAGKKAEETARAILKKDPENADGMIILAVALSMQKEKLGDALKELKKLRSRYPERAEGYVLAARILASKGEYTEAENLLSSGLSKVKDKQPIYQIFLRLYSTQKQWDKAIHYAELFYASEPEAPGAFTTMAQLYEKKGDIATAEKKWLTALEKSDNNPEILLLYAQFLVRQKKVEQAEHILKIHLEKDPANLKIRLALARLLAGTRRGDEALQLLKTGYSDDMEKPAMLALVDEEAKINFDLGRFDKAQELTDDVLKENPKDLTALTIQAQMALVQRQGEKAVTILRQLVEEEPDNVKYMMLLAQAHATSGNYKLAENQLRKIINKHPEDLGAWQSLIRLFIIQKDMHSARNTAEEALKKLPDSAPLHNLMGMILWASKDPAGAEGNFRKAMELKSEWLVPYRNLAALKIKTGDPAEAEKTFREAAAKYPDAPGPKILLASLYEQTGQPRKAVAIYEKLLKKHPKSVIIMNNLAFLYADTGTDKETLDKALSLINRALARLENIPPTFLDTLAWVHYKAGQTNIALEAINRAIAKAPDNPTLLYHQAVILKENGQTQQAFKSVEKALEQGRPFPERQKAEELRKVLGEN